MVLRSFQTYTLQQQINYPNPLKVLSYTILWALGMVLLWHLEFDPPLLVILTAICDRTKPLYNSVVDANKFKEPHKWGFLVFLKFQTVLFSEVLAKSNPPIAEWWMLVSIRVSWFNLFLGYWEHQGVKWGHSLLQRTNKIMDHKYTVLNKILFIVSKSCFSLLKGSWKGHTLSIKI